MGRGVKGGSKRTRETHAVVLVGGEDVEQGIEKALALFSLEGRESVEDCEEPVEHAPI